MARMIYGGSGAAQVVSPDGTPTVASATVMSARTGGVTVTDIQNMAGQNIGGIVTPDTRGQVLFQGPDGAADTYWLDFGDGGPRWAVEPASTNAAIADLIAAQQAAQYLAPDGVTPHASIPYTDNDVTRKMAEALDEKVVPRFASITARDAAFPSPTDGDRCYRSDAHVHQTYRTGLGEPANRWVADSTLIYEGYTSSNYATIMFDSIPQVWRNLRLVYRTRSVSSNSLGTHFQRVSIRLNSDDTTNYTAIGDVERTRITAGVGKWNIGWDTATTGGANDSDPVAWGALNDLPVSALGATTCHVGLCPGSSFTTMFGGGEIRIDDYSASGTTKGIRGNSGFGNASGAVSGTGYMGRADLQGAWGGTAPVNRIDIFPVSAVSFASGSYFALYGDG